MLDGGKPSCGAAPGETQCWSWWNETIHRLRWRTLCVCRVRSSSELQREAVVDSLRRITGSWLLQQQWIREKTNQQTNKPQSVPRLISGSCMTNDVKWGATVTGSTAAVAQHIYCTVGTQAVPSFNSFSFQKTFSCCISKLTLSNHLLILLAEILSLDLLLSAEVLMGKLWIFGG